MNYNTKQQSDALNIALRNYADAKLNEYYTKQESYISLTKQDNLIIPVNMGVSYNVIIHDNNNSYDIVRSIAGVGPISITGNVNPDYGEITDLQIGFNESIRVDQLLH